MIRSAVVQPESGVSATPFHFAGALPPNSECQRGFQVTLAAAASAFSWAAGAPRVCLAAAALPAASLAPGATMATVAVRSAATESVAARRGRVMVCVFMVPPLVGPRR